MACWEWPLSPALALLPAVGQFFNASCVPVNNAKEYPSSLCALCVGDELGRHKCIGNSQERYYGDSGAFRCWLPLAWGGGFTQSRKEVGKRGREEGLPPDFHRIPCV